MARTGFTQRLALFHRTLVTTACTLLFVQASWADDTGDAPASYGQATHVVVPGSPFLGFEEPDDNASVAGITAMGDDNDGVDDEGGVFAFPVLVQNSKSYDTNVFATNPGDTDATLVGWIDFDGDRQFDADEAASATVPAGTVNQKFKLVWPDLTGVTNAFAGTSYARFRISTDPLTAANHQGAAGNGEVEDYSLEILLDSDGDERPDISDNDNDNDGIPDAFEGVTADTDGDGIPDYLDTDSDADGIPDYIEAGSNPVLPADTDNDGTPDYLDQDSNNDGAPDSDPVSGDRDQDTLTDDVEGMVDTDRDGVLDLDDMDSDNDTIPDVIEAGSNAAFPVDTDGDGIADYLDLDSDNDGIADIREANSGEFDVNFVDANNDGRIDSQVLTGSNGYADLAETAADSGVPKFAIADTDGDGVRDFRESDSDSDGINDILEAGGADADGDGVVDSTVDIDQDGMVDGANLVTAPDSFPDVDSDNIPDFQDNNADGSAPAVVVQDDEPSVPAEPTVPSSDPVSSPTAGPLATPTVSLQSGLIETGLSGAGCTIGSPEGSGTDFMLWLLLALAVARLRFTGRRRALVTCGALQIRA